jgi:hypothetical protein
VRNVLILLALTLPTSVAVGFGSLGSKISQLPDGTMSGNVYSNDALGLRFKIPDGWIATADPKGPVELDPRTTDGPVNQCSKILLSLHAPHPVEGRFGSVGDLFVIDPGCFSDAEFPTSPDKKKVLQFAGKIIKFFRNTPYISPGGADVNADRTKCSDPSYGPCRYGGGGLVTIFLTGETDINAFEDQTKKERLHVNTLFSLTEFNGYWVAWTAFADDPSKEQLKNAKVQFKDAP